MSGGFENPKKVWLDYDADHPELASALLADSQAPIVRTRLERTLKIISLRLMRSHLDGMIRELNELLTADCLDWSERVPKIILAIDALSRSLHVLRVEPGTPQSQIDISKRIISHNANNTLVAIRSRIELAIHQDQNPFKFDAKKKTIIDNALYDLNAAIQSQIFDAVPIAEAEKYQNVFDIVDLLNTRILPKAKEMLRARGIGINFEIEIPNRSIFICGSPEAIYIHILNIIRNAADHAFKGWEEGSTPRFHLSLNVHDSHPILALSDNGNGMPLPLLSSLNSRQGTTRNAVTDGEGGFGLYRIDDAMAKMGATLNINSAQRDAEDSSRVSGTTFRIAFPDHTAVSNLI